MKCKQSGFRWGWFSFALAVGAGCFYWGYRTGRSSVPEPVPAIVNFDTFYTGLQPDREAKWKELGRWVGFGFRNHDDDTGFTGSVSLFGEPCPKGGFGSHVNAGSVDTADYRHRIMWIVLEEQDCIYTVTRQVERKCGGSHGK